MKHAYNISGMTCAGCAAKVKSKLLIHPDVLSAEVDLERGKALIEMQKHIGPAELQTAIGTGKYAITEDIADTTHQQMKTTTWLETYKPILLIFTYITGTTLLVQFVQGGFNLMEWMRHFMAGFFLVFSFFKLLDISGFAGNYSSYDIIAKRLPAYGYIYPFIELALGILFLFPGLHYWSNLVTLVVMSVSIIGVLQSIFKKQQIECACLGTVFKLPMSTVTIIEDGLMIVMSIMGLLLA